MSSSNAASSAHQLRRSKITPASEQCMNRAESTNSFTSTADNPRARASSSYMTEIVKALFGGDPVGNVVEDFSCSFQRQAGRMYVSTDGLFFYSNLFGFEKKIRIDYAQALDIKILRTTSLSVKTVGEDYIFRSFDNRERVLAIINSYHSSRGLESHSDVIPAAQHQEGTPNGTIPIQSSALHPIACDKSGDETDNDTSVRDDDSSVSLPDPINVLQSTVSQNTARKEKNSGVNDSIEKTDESYAWKELQQRTKVWDSAVGKLYLPCKSTQDFFDLFLVDDASNSLYVFHSDVIGDKNIFVGAWQTDNTEEEAKSLSRTINYDHQNALSVAKVTRQQTYQRYGCHACLKNVTNIKGIKGVPSDAFFVEDIWLIESIEDEGVVLSVKFQVKFTKSTMLKSIIKSRATAETKEWYGQFKRYLVGGQGMQQEAAPQEKIAPTTTSAKMNADWIDKATTLLNWVQQFLLSARQFLPDLSAPVVLIVALSLVIYRLKLRVLALEELVGEFEQRLFELSQRLIGLEKFAVELPNIEIP